MDLHDEIARTAHELYEKSGWIPGRDLENWIEAEKIVKSRLNGGSVHKKQSEKSAEEPIRKATSTEAKKAVEPRKAADAKKAPVKRTPQTKKAN